MEKLLTFMIVLVSTFVLWVKDVEIYVMDRAYRTLQYGLEHAVHDATLQIDKEAVSETGEIFFQPEMAGVVLLETLQRNLPVDESLRPTSYTFIEEPLIIRDVIYLDHDYIDPETGLTLNFPLNWSYTLPNGNEFKRAIFGPSIALVVDANLKGVGEYETFVVIQEYKNRVGA